MNEKQRKVYTWLILSELSFTENLYELIGHFDLSETIPNGVMEIFNELTEDEQIEVIYWASRELR